MHLDLQHEEETGRRLGKVLRLIKSGKDQYDFGLTTLEVRTVLLEKFSIPLPSPD